MGKKYKEINKIFFNFSYFFSFLPSLLFLQGVKIIGNIICIIKIIIRISNNNKKSNSNSENLNKNSNENFFEENLPLFKYEELNITINILILLISISTGIFVAKLFLYHSQILMKNLTTYQDIKMSADLPEDKIAPFLYSQE